MKHHRPLAQRYGVNLCEIGIRNHCKRHEEIRYLRALVLRDHCDHGLGPLSLCCRRWGCNARREQGSDQEGELFHGQML